MYQHRRGYGAGVGGPRIAREMDERDADENQYRYEYTAHQIEREDGLANYRLTWTLQLNGFLFAALALVGDGMDERLQVILPFCLPVAGMVVSLAALSGTLAVFLAIKDLASEYKELPGPGRHGSPWPRPYGGAGAFWLGQLPNLGLPLLLFLVWFALFISVLVSTPIFALVLALALL